MTFFPEPNVTVQAVNGSRKRLAGPARLGPRD